jgi:hypothetical protein
MAGEAEDLGSHLLAILKSFSKTDEYKPLNPYHGLKTLWPGPFSAPSDLTPTIALLIPWSSPLGQAGLS